MTLPDEPGSGQGRATPGLSVDVLTALYRLGRPLLFRAYGGDPEAIHDLILRLLAGPGSWAVSRRLLRALTGAAHQPVTVAGVRFPGRVGLAAGLDKDGHAVRAWQALGFSFAEVGTVTAQAQPGNDRPRLFRLQASGALLNRMGFNNDGAAALVATLSRANVYRGNNGVGIPVGVSIGKTKTVPVEAAVPDYLASLTAVAPHADYVAVNVSSPNTPGLRDLQGQTALRELATALVGRARKLVWNEPRLVGTPWEVRPLPIFVKVAPDLTWAQLDQVLAVCEETGISGIIATNTTLSRQGLAEPDVGMARESGGLSGRPLIARAREVVTYVTGHTSLPVIGSGGVMTVDDATALFDRGASLVQVYSGFIYGGPALPVAIERALS